MHPKLSFCCPLHWERRLLVYTYGVVCIVFLWICLFWLLYVADHLVSSHSNYELGVFIISLLPVMKSRHRKSWNNVRKVSLPDMAEQGFEPRETDSKDLEPNHLTPYEDCLLEIFYFQQQQQKVVNAELSSMWELNIILVWISCWVVLSSYFNHQTVYISIVITRGTSRALDDRPRF